tara:strand:+ start:630 stop:1100 length:471 start_codon:yes stop_codon:yes gene_type:complete
MSYDYQSYANQIQDRLDEDTTIGVRDHGTLVSAQITNASGDIFPEVSLQLYRNRKGYVSEETSIHLCDKKPRVPWSPLEVKVRNHRPKPESSSPSWSTIKIGRDYIGNPDERGENGEPSRLFRSSIVFLPTSELVTIRDELTKAIEEATTTTKETP